MIKISDHGDKIFIAEDNCEDDVFPVTISSRLTNELGKDLLKAAANGDVSETQRLLSEGAPFTADWLGTNPLHLAAQGNHVEICKILLRSGISANARTKVDRTPLHMAAYEGHLEIVELLLKDKAEIDETDLMEMTALHWACQNGHVQVVKALLEYGANKDLANKFGLQPVDIANQIGRFDIANLLEQDRYVDPAAAAQNLTVEMTIDDAPPMNNNAVLVEDVDESCMTIDDEMPQIKLCTDYNGPHIDHSLSDSMKILQEHGITLLPADDDNNILSTVMESGHSVVLTEVGKELLESVKIEEEAAQNITRNMVNLEREKFISVHPDTLSNGGSEKKEKQVINKQSRNIRPGVMKKSKLQSVSLSPNILRQTNQVRLVKVNSKQHDVQVLLKELAEAKKTIEMYKTRLKQKEAEAESYKKKLKFLGCS